MKEKKINVNFAVTPHTAKVSAIVHDKCLVEKEKALYLWMEDMKRKYVLADYNVLH